MTIGNLRMLPEKPRLYPKILLWDVETSDMELSIRSYELKCNIKRFPIESIKRDWTMLGASWKLLGPENRVSCISVSPQNPLDDTAVVYKLHEVLSDADILIGHNGDAFDYKKFNTRAIILGLPPIAPKQTIDTLKIARKYFRFTSNKLRYIAKVLGVDAKDESPDWEKVINGDPEELRYMRSYNKQDVIVLEGLYDRLRAYHHTHPNLGVYIDLRDTGGERVDVCPTCASPSIKTRGYSYTKTGKKRRYCCDSCGAWSTSGKSVKTTDIR